MRIEAVLTREKANGVVLVSTVKETRCVNYDEFVRDFMIWWEGELIRNGEGKNDLGPRNPGQGLKAKRPG